MSKKKAPTAPAMKKQAELAKAGVAPRAKNGRFK